MSKHSGIAILCLLAFALVLSAAPMQADRTEWPPGLAIAPAVMVAPVAPTIAVAVNPGTGSPVASAARFDRRVITAPRGYDINVTGWKPEKRWRAWNRE